MLALCKGVVTWYWYEFHSGTKSTFVPRLHGSHFTGMIQSFMWALILTSHFGALLPIDRHSLPVPVNSATHLIPVRMKSRTSFTWYRYRMWSYFIPVWSFRTGQRTGVNSYRYDSYWYKISYRYHVNEYRTTSGHQDELVPVSCKKTLIISFPCRWHIASLVTGNA